MGNICEPRARARELSFVLLMAFFSGPTAGQPVDRPQWKVGDRWVFRQTLEGEEKTTKWSREVLEAIPDGRFRVSWGRNRQETYDDQGNRLDPRGPEFTAKYYVFPMAVGGRWTNETKTQGELWSGVEHSTWDVKARETINVPAGTFECLRVEGKIWRSWADGRLVSQSFNRASTEWTYWYCPEVQWFAKQRIREQAVPWLGYFVRESVLTSFSRGP